jgi:hypothetical protein
MTVTVMQAYRFALDPTPAQARDLERHAGAARFAYNWALAAVKANIGQRAAERSYGLDGDDLTPILGWNLPALRRAWNATKHEVAPWWTECSKEAFNTGLDGVARALKNFGDSKSGKRAGRKAGFPRFKARRRVTPSVRFTTGTIRVETDRHHITLPRLGGDQDPRVHPETGTPHRAGQCPHPARILSATVRREAGRWLCSFTCEVQRARRASLRPDVVVGVDLGITHLAVLSSPVPGVSDAGGFVSNPSAPGPGATHLATCLAACVPPWWPGPAHRSTALPDAGRKPTGSAIGFITGSPPCARGRAAHAHHRPCRHHRHCGGRGRDRGRDAAQQAARPINRGRWVRGDPASVDVQDRVARRSACGGRPLVPLVHDVFAFDLSGSETHTVPLDAGVPV